MKTMGKLSSIRATDDVVPATRNQAIIHVMPGTEVDEIEPTKKMLANNGLETIVVTGPVSSEFVNDKTALVVDFVTPSSVPELGRDGPIAVLRDTASVEVFVRAKLLQDAS